MIEPSKELLYNEDARAKMRAGVNKLANAVRETMGPRGRNVIFERNYGQPSITKDGVTVAKEVVLKDPFENLGAQVIREVAAKTGDESGDGTTTATVLAQAIVNEGERFLVAGSSPVEIKRGMDALLKFIVLELREMAVPVNSLEDISNVASISANNEPEIGRLIADAIDAVGKDGVITVSESGGSTTELATEDGFQVNGPLLSRFFLPANEASVEFEDCWVLVADQDFQAVNDLVPILGAIHRSHRPVLIVCSSMSGPALHTILVNVQRGQLKAAVVQAPSFGDNREAILEDISIATGGQLFGYKAHCTTLPQGEDLSCEGYLGKASRVTVTKGGATVLGGAGTKEAVKERIDGLTKLLGSTSSEFDKEKIQQRIGALSGGVAVISIGGNSEVEVKEIKDRVDDALHATRAAISGGIVPGGGTALVWAITRVMARADLPAATSPDQEVGRRLLLKVLESPLRQIVVNAGKSGDVILARVMQGEVGYNAHTDTFEDLMVSGVIDPVNVTISALTNAVSVAGTLLTTSCAMVLERNENPFSNPNIPGL